MFTREPISSWFTLNWVSFAPPARTPIQIGLLFTNKNNCDFGAISVTERSCAAPISQEMCSPIGHNNTNHFLCPIRSRHPLEFLEIVWWESVPRGSSALLSHLFSRPDWLHLGVRRWLIAYLLIMIWNKNYQKLWLRYEPPIIDPCTKIHLIIPPPPPFPFLLFVLKGFFYFGYKSPCIKAPSFVSPAKPLTKMCKPIINVNN